MRKSFPQLLLAAILFGTFSSWAAEPIHITTFYRNDLNQLTGIWETDCYGNFIQDGTTGTKKTIAWGNCSPEFQCGDHPSTAWRTLDGELYCMTESFYGLFPMWDPDDLFPPPGPYCGDLLETTCCTDPCRLYGTTHPCCTDPGAPECPDCLGN